MLQGFYGDIMPIAENQVGKNMEHGSETGLGLLGVMLLAFS